MTVASRAITGLGIGVNWRVVQTPPHGAAFVAPAETNGFDEHAEPATYYAVPEIPSIARDAAGRPIFSCTLLLSRAPEANEESVHDLIQQSLVNFDLSLQLPDNILAALSSSAELAHDDREIEVRPLFVRKATFKLLSLQGEGDSAANVLATASSSGGTVIRTSLQATLNREQTTGLIGAIDGGASNLILQAEITYRVSGTTRRRLYGDWLAIYDFISQRVASVELTREDLRILFDEMIGARVLIATPNDDEANATHLFEAFMRQSLVILTRNVEANTYTLRARPSAGFSLEHEEESSGDSLETLTIEKPLENIIGGLLDGMDRNAFIRLVSLIGGRGSGGIGPPPRPQRFVQPGASRWTNGSREHNGRSIATEKIALAMKDGTLESVAFKLRPDIAAGRNAQAMITSGFAKRLNNSFDFGRLDWVLNDWHFDKALMPLPIVDDPNAPVWPDRISGDRLWYAPAFELLTPQPNANPNNSPFQFRFRRIGITPSGEAVLDGTVRFTLRAGMSSQTQAALRERGNPTAMPVPMNNLAVSLVLPFVNANNNELTRHALPCTIAQEGSEIVASVRLTSEWVRLAYTSLSNPTVFSEPAKISIAFSYEAYSRTRTIDFKLVFGKKRARIPVVFSPEQLLEVQDPTYFDASTLTLHMSDGAVFFKRGRFDVSRARPRPADDEELPDEPEPEPEPEPVEPEEVPPPRLPPTRPPIKQPEINEIITEAQLARRTLLREQQLAVAFPCNVFGEFYRESNNDQDVAIGCRPALELGRISYKRYEHIPQLDSVVNEELRYRVFRSLQQPGRFLVLPTRYAIARHSPGTPDEYKPRVLYYADENPQHALQTPIIFKVDLQPDLAPHERRDLELKLARLAEMPVVEYPTAIQAETTFSFLAMDSTPVSALRTPDSITVSISATSADLVLLQTRLQTGGITGTVRFDLGDGTALNSQLSLDLRYVTGPWLGGAVTVARSEDSIRLKNQIAQPVTVHDLMVVSDGDRRLIPLERVIPEGGSEAMLVFALPEQAELYPIYTTSATPEALNKIQNAIERIHINVLFINSINFSNHNLAALSLFVRRTGSSLIEQFSVTAETDVIEADFLMPLTEYVASPSLELRIEKAFSDGRREVKEWFNRDLAPGHVISLLDLI